MKFIAKSKKGFCKKLFFLFVLSGLSAQELDSLKTDSLQNDSIVEVKVQSFSPTSYFSEYSISSQNEKGEQITVYEGKAKLIYEDMKIEAHRIEVNFATNTLVATPKIDSLEDGRVKHTGDPVFTQAGNDPMHGVKMYYDFKSRRGRIFEGKTTVQTAKYEGEEIKKFGEKTLLIRNGKFTTCLADSPSYWIHSNKIRMIQNDMVFTGPLYMTIYDVPFPIPLPFGVFSMKRGRRSGIIIPSFFSGTTRGRGLSNLGYYWAASDYFEAEFLTDFYERTGLVYRLNTSFRDRYNYRGSFSGHYEPKDQITGEREDRYGFRFNYNHTIDPSLTIAGGGSFESSQSNRQNYRDFQNQTNQTLSSRLSATKRWSSSSLTTNFSHTKNLLTKSESYTAPNLTYRVNNFALFGEADDPLNKSWYEKINVSYNSTAKNTWNNQTQQDTAGVYQEIDETRRLGAKHTIGLSAPYKLFKYITFNPRFNYKETWVTEVQEIDESSADSLIIKEKKQFAALRTFDLGLTLNTNLYGLIEPNIGDFKVLRHKLSPSISFSYQPDFSTETFGYTETVTQDKYNSSKVRTRKDGTKFIDRFALSAYDKTPSNERFSASLSLGNTFSGKFVDDESNESKVDFMDFRSSTSIDFLKDSLQWNDLSSSFSFPFIKTFSFSGNMTHSLYKLDENGNRRKEFVNWIPILKTISFSSSYRLDQKIFSGEKNTENKTEVDSLDNQNSLKKRISRFKTQTIPWSINLSSSYSYNRFSSGEKTRWTATVSAQLNLTKKWKISYNTSIDMNSGDLQYQNVNITRDLECWNFNFAYSPNPYNSYFLLTLNIKDDMLKDIEYKRHSRNLPSF